MRASDIETLVSLGRPALAPDGSFVVFATSRPDVLSNTAVGQLWRIDLPDGAPRRITRGAADTSPRLSPDGRRIAFLRRDAKDKAQVFVVDPAGGEPVQATDAALGVTEIAWSPDGRALAFTTRVPEVGRYGDVEGMDAAAEAPRRITGIRWHANGVGYMLDRPSHVFVVAAPETDAEPFYDPAPAVPTGDDAPKRPVVAAEARQVSDGDGTSYSGIAYTADGAEVLAIADSVDQQRPDLRNRVVALPVDVGDEREVVGADADLAIAGLAVADDGTLALVASDVGSEGVDFVAADNSLRIVENGSPRPLTDPETVDLGEEASHVTPLGDDFLVQNRSRGRVHLTRVGRDGATVDVLGGDVVVRGHAAASGVVVASVATAESFGELVLISDEGPRTLTAFGATADAAGIASARELTVTGRDGYDVHGWVMAPAGDGPFPVILQIHGGPYAGYGVALFDETQVLVDAGYAVAYCNPRGSAGYGRAHGRSIRRAMGTVDLHDVLDFLDGAVDSDPRLDGSRVGVMGGSYGGYLTAWTIAHDARFAGAIVERGMLDPTSFQGTSDIGTFFGDEYIGVSADDIARQSPMAVVDRVETPTLVIHSELDFRCPLEQATRYYSALKRNGVDAEMLIFPGEHHELSRTGQPRHRVQRFDAIVDWWRRRLPTS